MARRRRELPDADYLTTGQVAAALCIAPRTASKLFDAGVLSGHRIAFGRHGGGDRRISRESLLRYCREQGVELLATNLDTVLGVGLGREAKAALAWLPAGWTVTAAATAVEAAAMVVERRPEVVVVDTLVGRSAAADLAAMAAARGVRRTVAVVYDGDPDVAGCLSWPVAGRRDALVAAVTGGA